MSEYYAIIRDTVKAIAFAKEANLLSKEIKNSRDYLASLEALSELDTKNAKMLLAKNYIKNYDIGLYEAITFKPLNWSSTNIGLNIYYSHAKSSIPITNQSLSGWGLESSINNDFILQKDKKLLLNIAYVFASNGVSNLDRNLSFSQLDIALKLFLLNKNLQVTFTGNDILGANKQEYIGLSNNIKTSFKNYRDLRYFRVSAIYNIGKRIKVNEREIKNEEEKDRTN